MNQLDKLKLENQLCFPLYASAKEIVRLYTPYLKQTGLTYTQYIVMLVLWQEKQMNLKNLGKILYLDTGTLTPLLKKLEKKGLIHKQRDASDERNVIITITDGGMALREQVAHIPDQIRSCFPLSLEESSTLYHLLYKILDKVKENVYDNV